MRRSIFAERLVSILKSLIFVLAAASVRLSAQTISGRVYDSVAKAPLAGATVELVASPPGSTNPIRVTTDSVGRYTLTDVSPGKYVLGFSHAVLDSIGIEQPFVRIEVGSPLGARRIDLGVPGPAQILNAVCGTQTAKDSGGVVLGHVYDASTRSGVDGGSVVAEWRSFGVVANRLRMANPQVIATTARGGWFAICGVPRGDDVILEAARGGDTTGAVTVRVPAHGLARHELFVDKNEIVTVPVRDSLGAPDTARGSERVNRGRSRLTGTVVDSKSGQPIAGAQVVISGAALTGTTNDRGVFNISGAPGGTQSLLIRAVRYAPEQAKCEPARRNAAVDRGSTHKPEDRVGHDSRNGEPNLLSGQDWFRAATKVRVWQLLRFVRRTTRSALRGHEALELHERRPGCGVGFQSANPHAWRHESVRAVDCH